jgi:hypothetical protein
VSDGVNSDLGLAWSGLHERGVFRCGKKLSGLFHFKPPEVLRTNGPRTPGGRRFSCIYQPPASCRSNRRRGIGQNLSPKAKNPFGLAAKRVSLALAAFVKRPQAELNQIGALHQYIYNSHAVKNNVL